MGEIEREILLSFWKVHILLTERGREVLAILRAQIAELYREVVLGEEEG